MADSTGPERFFSDRYGVSSGALERALGTALARRADYGDLYFEFRTTTVVALEDGLVKKASKDVAQGVGVRVLAGEKTGYAYSDDVTVATIEHAARTAGHIASDAGGAQAVALRPGHQKRDGVSRRRAQVGHDRHLRRHDGERRAAARAVAGHLHRRGRRPAATGHVRRRWPPAVRVLS